MSVITIDFDQSILKVCKRYLNCYANSFGSKSLTLTKKQIALVEETLYWNFITLQSTFWESDLGWLWIELWNRIYLWFFDDWLAHKNNIKYLSSFTVSLESILYGSITYMDCKSKIYMEWKPEANSSAIKIVMIYCSRICRQGSTVGSKRPRGCPGNPPQFVYISRIGRWPYSPGCISICGR